MCRFTRARPAVPDAGRDGDRTRDRSVPGERYENAEALCAAFSTLAEQSGILPAPRTVYLKRAVPARTARRDRRRGAAARVWRAATAVALAAAPTRRRSPSCR